MTDWNDQALELIRIYGFADHAEQLALVARPTIHARLQHTDIDRIPRGATRFGGNPDLPPDTIWPTNAGRPFTHIAQIHLPDVAPFDLDHLLPKTGWLVFWVLCDDPNETNDDEPLHKVLYIEEGAQLRRTLPPKTDRGELVLRCCAAEFGAYYSLPDGSWNAAHQFDFDGEKWDYYSDFTHDLRDIAIKSLPPLPKRSWWRRLFRPHRFGFHQLLGYPERALLSDEDQQCVLLFQVRSDDTGLGATWTWGDGSLNYLIDRNHLAESRFEATRMVMYYGN